jgi:hypothetical protein
VTGDFAVAPLPHLTASALPELVGDRRYRVRSEADSTTFFMPSEHHGLSLIILWAVLVGSVLIGVGSLWLIHDPSANWSMSMIEILAGSLLVGPTLWLGHFALASRVMVVGPGRAVVALSLLWWTVRLSTYDVRFIVIHHQVWTDGDGSTDTVVLEGHSGRYVVESVSNMCRSGTFTGPVWRIGPGSEDEPRLGGGSARTVSPLILGLARALGERTLAPIVLQVGETAGPLIRLGGD